MRLTLGSTATRDLSKAAAQRVDGAILRFAAVGALTTVLDFALFSVFIEAGAFAVAANLGSYSCGVLTSFAFNNWWTFRAASGRCALRAFTRFVLSNLAGLTLSTLLVGLFALLLPAPVAKLASVPLVFVWNFAAARFWVFR